VAVVYYAQKEDTDRPEGVERRRLPRSVRPSANPEEAARATTTSHSAANPHLANVAAIVRGLREGTASSRRKIANQIEASGVRVAVERESTARRGVERAKDNARIARLSQMPVLAASAAKGLSVHQYKSAPRPSGHDVRSTAKTDAEFGQPSKLVRRGKIAERKTMFPVTAPVTLGDDDAATFGVDEAPASRGVVGMAKAPLRNGDRGEDIERRDSDGLGDTF
jgi:hypothetical protein